MNKEYIKFHLNEAREDLEKIVNASFGDDYYLEAHFMDDIKHIYHHLNTAVNARNSTKEQAEECSEENYIKWRQMPEDIDLSD